MLKSFEELKCWQKSRELCQCIFRLVNQAPFSRDFSLKDQILRSSGSVMDNIAEGFGRGGNKEFIQFLFYSKGSCLEVMSQLYRAKDRAYLSESEFKELYKLADEVARMIQGLVSYLKKSKMTGIKYK
jgi:four helix bundle protein